MWILVMIALRSIPSAAVVGKECRRDSGGPVEESDPLFQVSVLCRLPSLSCVRRAHLRSTQCAARSYDENVQLGKTSIQLYIARSAMRINGKSSLFAEKCVNACLKGNGAGDGNRKYRCRALAFWNHEVAIATGVACDFCVKNRAIRANASQCDHLGTSTD
jgi:hypothetical protein